MKTSDRRAYPPSRAGRAAVAVAVLGCLPLPALGDTASEAQALNRPLFWASEGPGVPSVSAAPPPPPPQPQADPGNTPPAPRPVEKRPYGDLIASVADEFGLDARLVHAVVSVESNYNASSVSRKGAVGLMQLMPSTARSLGFTNLRDAGTNLRAGATYLKSLLERYDDNLELALAAYNAGAGAVDRNGPAIPPYSETRQYVRRVLARYRAAGGDESAPSGDGTLRAAALELRRPDLAAAPAAMAHDAAQAGPLRDGESWTLVRKLGSLILSAPAD